MHNHHRHLLSLKNANELVPGSMEFFVASPSNNSQYKLRAQARISTNCGESEWSEWSPLVVWGNRTGEAAASCSSPPYLPLHLPPALVFHSPNSFHLLYSLYLSWQRGLDLAFVLFKCTLPSSMFFYLLICVCESVHNSCYIDRLALPVLSFSLSSVYVLSPYR